LSLTQGLAEAFAAALDRLGPFEPRPALAVAVSGGADSMALAILARDWVGRRDGSVLGLTVDHGLRATSADEARLTIERLARAGIASRVLTLSDLAHGAALAERARIMRYEILERACAEAGVLHLLLGHHAADQAETVAMRVLRGSGTHGLAGMSALRETSRVRLLRPLLGLAPDRLRHLLTAYGVGWVEDPSNHDPRALRSRLRRGLSKPQEVCAQMRCSGGTNHRALAQALADVGKLRQREEAAMAAELAEHATIRPEGFALLSPGRVGAASLAALIRTIGGAPYDPSPAKLAELAAQPKPATVAGVRILPAGRFGDGLLLIREEAAIAASIPAADGAIWDRRFRLIAPQSPPAGATIAKLGHDAARLRAASDLPAAVLRTLPAIRVGDILVSVPNIGYTCRENDFGMTMMFSPRKPLAGPLFLPAG
jgi:tRNA(Ile)-lysidine synthase